MSDETPPAPLRLRPRPRPEGETPAAASEGEEGKLRLKPKLDVEAEPEVAAEPEDESEPPVEPVRAKPRLSLEPEPEPELVAEEVSAEPLAAEEPVAEAEVEEPPPPMPEEGKVKLKIKVPGALAQETAEPLSGEEESPSLPPFPVVAPPAEEDQNVPPLLVGEAAPGRLASVTPSAGSPPAVFKRSRVPAALLAAERRKRLWKYAAIAVGGVLLAGAVIGGAYLKFTPTPSAVTLPPRPAYVPPPEPVAEVAPVPKVVPPPPLPVEPVSGERVTSTATYELAPGVTATTESIKAVPNASPAFRTFVASAKISGVFQGASPRAFINGRMVRAGEMVDEMMEINFDSVDPATRSIVFKDSTGATVSRRY